MSIAIEYFANIQFNRRFLILPDVTRPVFAAQWSWYAMCKCATAIYSPTLLFFQGFLRHVAHQSIQYFVTQPPPPPLFSAQQLQPPCKFLRFPARFVLLTIDSANLSPFLPIFDAQGTCTLFFSRSHLKPTSSREYYGLHAKWKLPGSPSALSAFVLSMISFMNAYLRKVL
jgi:hypothetical protein